MSKVVFPNGLLIALMQNFDHTLECFDHDVSVFKKALSDLGNKIKGGIKSLDNDYPNAKITLERILEELFKRGLHIPGPSGKAFVIEKVHIVDSTGVAKAYRVSYNDEKAMPEYVSADNVWDALISYQKRSRSANPFKPTA